MKIQEEFETYWLNYMAGVKNPRLEYKITSTDREGNSKTNPHALKGNAMDISLRYKGDYAAISWYNSLFEWLFKNWPYRAGIDNTEGNIHIHLDLGKVIPDGQKLPFFFKEDGGKFLYQITKPEQIA